MRKNRKGSSKGKITKFPAKGKTHTPLTAEEMAGKQREISVSEFFTKNRHLLGFDNPTRALLTAVKEAVDNSLDACEEAGHLPDIKVKIKQKSEDRFHLTVEDNGPGIVGAQIPNIFGKLLYGSKFHTLKMSRGQQGIGISAVCLYSQLTTGKGMKITSRTRAGAPAHCFQVMIDTSRNQPKYTNNKVERFGHDHGTRIEFELEGRYVKGDKSVDQYLKETCLANPHVKLTYDPPGENGRQVYSRVIRTLPKQAREIKPHPYGVELGTLIKMLQASTARDLRGCLKNEFSRVSDKIAGEILKHAKLDGRAKTADMTSDDFERLYRGINKTKIMAPPTDCLVPISEEQMLKALQANVKAEFYTTLTRPPAVYRGNPFQLEIGLAYGIEGFPDGDSAEVNRYANRVPLLYQPGACALNKCVTEVDWKKYGITQPRGRFPEGPMLLMVHMASVWVPFTSEAKEAVAHYPEIMKEVRLGLQECGRRASIHVRRKARLAHQLKRKSIFERYIEEVSTSLNNINKCGRDKVRNKLLKMAKGFTTQMEKEEQE